MFVKLFGHEVHFTKITPKAIDELVSQIKDLVLGKKDEIQTALGGRLCKAMRLLLRICAGNRKREQDEETTLFFFEALVGIPACDSTNPIHTRL
jgi:hypothetical protein